jgi:hypothetical protein
VELDDQWRVAPARIAWRLAAAKDVIVETPAEVGRR